MFAGHGILMMQILVTPDAQVEAEDRENRDLVGLSALLTHQDGEGDAGPSPSTRSTTPMRRGRSMARSCTRHPA